MRYIIMCGGTYQFWRVPRQLTEINGEPIIARTIRLLRENGVNDIAISSSNPVFEKFGVPMLRHENNFTAFNPGSYNANWVDAFYPTDEPTCYLFGDVVFSPEAIRTIAETDTDDIQFFASAPPFGDGYVKPWAEPFALKVRNTEHLKHAISLTKRYEEQGLFLRKPIMWELWQVIQATPLNHINYKNYVVINDYTCDIDSPNDADVIERAINDKQAL